MNALNAIQSHINNFNQSIGSNAVSIARQLLPISEDALSFLVLLEKEVESQVIVWTESRYSQDIRDSAYASYIDLAKMYSDVQEYIVFWQAQDACQIPAYAERYSGISQNIGAFFAAMARYILLVKQEYEFQVAHEGFDFSDYLESKIADCINLAFC